MSSEDKQKRLNENYRLIPMKDITDEARDIAVMWIEGYKPAGIINLEQKHKLASDIMNYAALHAKDFLEWYSLKMVGFVEYLTKVKPIVKSEEIEERLLEFEGQTFDNLYAQFIEHQSLNK